MLGNIASQIMSALLISANSVAVFSHGVFGLGSTFTAIYLIVVTGSLIWLGKWRSTSLNVADYLAIALFLCCGLSLALHPPADYKDLALLVLSFAAYPAARGLTTPLYGQTFMSVLAVIAAVGAVATTIALSTDLSALHGKAMVFDKYSHAPAQFTILVSLALVCISLAGVSLRRIAAPAVPLVCIFAAAQVRFAFIALMVALVVGFAARPAQRFRIMGIIGLITISISAGALLRGSTTLKFLRYAETSLVLPITQMGQESKSPQSSETEIDSPSQGCSQVNLDNSIDIRKRIYSQAAALLPSAGLTGIGFNEFAKRSCVGAEVHNSILQMAVEFGLPAALLFVLLILSVFRSLWLQRGNTEAALALCVLTFALLMSLVYGRVSEDCLLFFALGSGAAVIPRLPSDETASIGNALRKAKIQPFGALAVTMMSFMVIDIISMIVSARMFPAMHFWPSWPTIEAMTAAMAMTFFVPLFLIARFSFGYTVAFSLFSAVFGFVWLSFFSEFDYPHSTTRWALVAGLLAALVPLLFVRAVPIRPWTVRPALLRALLSLICVAVLIADASYGIQFGDPYGDLRNTVIRPTTLNYLTLTTIGTIIPYLFASFAARKQWGFAAGVLALSLSFYPVVLNKTVLLVPLWLPLLFWLYSRFEPRAATILAFVIPLLIGMGAFMLLRPFSPYLALYPLGTVSLRFVGVPVLALDQYADFFTHNPNTHFCQISIVRRFFGCMYGELGPTIGAAYRNGNFNASFLATEGIASVGLLLAPVSAFVCGSILSLGTIASRHLDARFIAVSSGLGVQLIMNVPLSTALLSNGLGMLFVLWWLTPAQEIAVEPTQVDAGLLAFSSGPQHSIAENGRSGYVKVD
ncbi:O-antigen ligase family protein [Bradyrhizobium sp. Arg816]|uniref:O-antigen ligase family protein n=1 Tax=Bradyrhizobium sp. Arg816 TaxID=2998491 RepID=UPI00249D8C95|nr:O-antigen ligase family protein [Bradyrhizobium sp. Arg816]MDI3566265.1 O-antigen ligase family protein [Bradyrhizobium sp. Arg816]